MHDPQVRRRDSSPDGRTWEPWDEFLRHMIRTEGLGGNENSLLLVALPVRQLAAAIPFERVTELPMLAPVEVDLELLLSQRKVREQPLDVAQEDLEHF